MLKTIIRMLSLCLLTTACTGQPRASQLPYVQSPAYDSTLQKLLSFNVPVIGVKELQKIKDEVFIFDTRKPEEFAQSHIEGARFLGYAPPHWEAVEDIPKKSPIIVYCSVGYRSEAVGKMLEDRGFSDVRNLYGGLFSWVNQGLPVVDTLGQSTQTVHTYDAEWSRWLTAPDIRKVW